MAKSIVFFLTDLFYQNLASFIKVVYNLKMYAKKIKIASIIITHNRVEEAKAQMDIIKKLWEPLFDSVDIYHEFNGQKNWYPKKYQEDYLYRHKPMSHLFGANHMLNQGIKHVLSSGKKYDFIIVTSSDAWFYDPKRLKEIILMCRRKRFELATSLWAVMVLSTEFFILTPELAKKVFPVRLAQVISKYKLLRWTYSKIPTSYESIFTFKVMGVLKNPNKIYLIPGRRVIWLKNRFYSSNFYASHHDQSKRRKDVSPKIYTFLGNKIENMPSLHKFLGSNIPRHLSARS